jgi:predicted small metal-binding protein
MASAPQIWTRSGGRGDAKVTPTYWHYAGSRARERYGGTTVKLIRCECGYVARADSDDQVVGMIRGHMASDHPAVLKSVSQQDLLSWIQTE